MLTSAAQFVRLRTSDDRNDYLRAAWDEAPLEVWLDVLNHYPDMAFWVAHNKSVPLPILEMLAKHPEERVRSMVASKNKLSPELQIQLAQDHECSVRRSIAYNKKAVLAALQLLAEEADEELKQHVRTRIAEGKHK
ncbi:hypothetical protein [Brevibacillus parabrevis]|uniref:hypothetical protein n=1 Tax=Brevibacillus parabrevis TaxID=54914 RepID=UPI002E215B13|nr:hypothetical protein [Brevibacillus parabrevis]